MTAKAAGIGLIIVIIIMGSMACTGEKEPSAIKFGILPVVDTLPLHVAQAEGFFDEENINMELIPFNSALERDAALQAGKIDGFFGDILSTIVMIDTGLDVSIVTVAFEANPANRMFAILAGSESDIEELSQLKGVEVGISSATIIEYLLDKMLSVNDFAPEDIAKLEVKQMPIRLQMLMGNEIKAALLPEPLVTLAESKGAKVLTDDRTLDDALTILAFTDDILSEDKTLKERFLKAYGRAVDLINENPEATRETLTANTRIPPDIENTYVIPSFPSPDVPSKADVAEVQDWLQENGIIEAPISYDRVVD
ncbi:MAG: ABC transporter substrate-binding protein [Chloroflexota bacterium]|nr:ABC transporter substrate-binding protein [Chloroflexota bacterium]